jgi:UDP-N-acetylglucosamine 2-epimerase (non-hydrolysing)
MIKLLSVVGARPNFMKVAPILRALEIHAPGKEGLENSRRKTATDFEHRFVHSGQHYDETLSGSFFAELDLPTPDVNLGVGSGSHAAQTAEVMKRIEPVLLEYKPQMVLVVGDVNSTLAAALTAVKLGIPVAHIEAGLRSFDMTMPEEINRKLTDAISTLLFVSERSGVDNLKKEGAASENVFLVGNVMIDSLLRHREVAKKSAILDRLGVRRNGAVSGPYGVLTLHRPSNVDDPKILAGILTAVSVLASDLPIFFPMHPRTRKNIESFGLGHFLSGETRLHKGIVPLDPLGYIDFLSLNDQARIVLTDSGGVQEETTVLGVPCLTLRENTERPATVEYGSNQVVGTDPARILAAGRSVLSAAAREYRRPPLWDGHAAERIVGVLRERLLA